MWFRGINWDYNWDCHFFYYKLINPTNATDELASVFRCLGGSDSWDWESSMGISSAYLLIAMQIYLPHWIPRLTYYSPSDSQQFF